MIGLRTILLCAILQMMGCESTGPDSHDESRNTGAWAEDSATTDSLEPSFEAASADVTQDVTSSADIALNSNQPGPDASFPTSSDVLPATDAVSDEANSDSGADAQLPPCQENFPCDDSDTCTLADTCQDGVCVGTPMVCDDGNTCTADTCEAGACFFTTLADGESCDDGDLCTLSGLCHSGFCSGFGSPCDDDNPCTDDSCVADTGVCNHEDVAGCFLPPTDFSLEDLNPSSATFLEHLTLGTFDGFLLVVAFHAAS